MSTIHGAVELTDENFLDQPEHPLLAEQPAVGWHELISLLTTVALADLAIYRGHGYAGWAAILAAVPVLLLVGSTRRAGGLTPLMIGLMLWAIALRLVWCGGPLAVGVGLVLLPAYVLALGGRVPYLFDGLAVMARLVVAGCLGVAAYGRDVLKFCRRFVPSQWVATALPLGVGSLFAAVFLMANPDLVSEFNHRLSALIEALRDWIIQYSAWEALFCLGVAWAAIGLLRPLLPRLASASLPQPRSVTPSEPAPAPLYAALRNTLLMVIGLFGAYLIFEFRTLWFRDFPKKFHYSGYAHEGAAWLTIALALATAVLSLIFRGRIQHDPRIGRLRTLAAIWSAESLILSVAVYHRLFIYVGYNGMTRMRFVGYFGVTAVVVGFLLVVVKIARQKDFGWLLQRHLWTLALAVFLFAITPVDYLAMRYNVQRVLSGDPAPSVQFSVQPLNAEALLTLPPLLACENETVRAGIQALLTDRQMKAEEIARHPAGGHWTAFQLANHKFLRQLQASLPVRPDRPADAARQNAWERFRAYAYQWY